jgi:predicted aspartyl protease
MKSQMAWLVSASVLFISVDSLSAQPHTQATDRVADPLEQALTKLGYIGIKLERENTGHLIASVEIEGKAGKRDLRMVVDCGSSVTLVTPETAKLLGLDVDKTNGSVGGVGGTGIGVATTKAKGIKLGAYEEKGLSLMVIDIVHVNTMFEQSGVKPVAGVIGSDWMLAKKALIDMESPRLFILPAKGK